MRYEAVEPSDRPSKGLTVECFGQDTTLWFDHFDKKVIPSWQEEFPLWLPAVPALVSRVDRYGERETRIGKLWFMLHYSALLQRIAYEITTQPDAKVDLTHMYSQLSGFISERLKAWGETVGR